MYKIEILYEANNHQFKGCGGDFRIVSKTYYYEHHQASWIEM